MILRLVLRCLGKVADYIYNSHNHTSLQILHSDLKVQSIGYNY